MIGEKKLIDADIVNALENTKITLQDLTEEDDDYEKLLLIKKITSCSLDLIHRLQSENANLKSELKKELAEHEEFTKKAKAEIERLTEEKTQSAETAVEVLEQNLELQKQVDELTAFKTEAISMSLYGKGRKDGEEVAVKDTAKEIYKEIGKGDILVVQTQEYGEIEVVPIERLKEIIKQKGVEVE